MSLLSCRDLSVTYPHGTAAVRGLNLEVEPGQCLALVGQSGCGKTSVALAILGMLPPGTTVTGSVTVEGAEVIGAPEAVLRRLRGTTLGFVPQDPFAAVDPVRRVGDHVMEAWRVHGLSPPSPAQVLTELGIDDAATKARQRPHQWSGGMLQRATIAAAEAHLPALTVADEPTSALDADLADKILAILRERSHGLLLISHDLGLVARHADRIAVCHAGRIVEIGDAAVMVNAPAHAHTAALLTARRPGPHPAADPAPVPAQVRGASTPVLTAVGLSRQYGHGDHALVALRDVDLTLARGEVLGVVGGSGSGKSTLLRLLGAIERPTAGKLHLAGRPAWPHRGRNRVRPGYVMPIFQDPAGSLDARWPLWRAVTEPLVAPHRTPRPNAQQRRAIATEGLARVGLATIDLWARPSELSVGQCQRASILRALLAEPELLLADEPTSALDVLVAADILALLRELAQAGTAIVVVSHDPHVITTLADRVMRMDQGRLLRQGATAAPAGDPTPIL